MDVLVSVRSASTRLPNKCFMTLDGMSVLEFVLRRALNAGFDPIVCTTCKNEDDLVISIAEKLNLRFFRGEAEDKILRWGNCVENFDISELHLLDGDDPYFDPIECSESMHKLREGKYSLVMTSERSDNGMASVGTSITGEFLIEIVKRSREIPSRNFDVIPWTNLIRENDKWTKMPDKYLISESNSTFRLTLDYLTDYKFLTQIARYFNFESPRLEVEKFLISNPEVARINSENTIAFLNNKKSFLKKMKIGEN
jgi:spore coat polysaccharide biosynthesis protein SpsF (cytidylyltransferase family)